MTSTTTFPSLSVPAPEDNMEMSSPSNRYFDGDIDIDFEDSYDGVQLTDDERMLEDHENNRPGTANDEMMQDDEQAPDIPVAEELMHDGPVTDLPLQQDEDDELIDYDDEEYMDNPNVTYDEHTQSVDVDPKEDVDSELLGQDTKKSTNTSAPEAAPIKPVNETHVSETIDPNVQFDKPDVLAKTSSPGEDRKTELVVLNEGEVPASDDVVKPGNKEVEHATGEGLIPPEENTQETKALHQAQSAEELDAPDVNSKPAADGSATPTDTGLHPMTMHWCGQTMQLFKSHLHPDGLLKDDNLVSVSLADFLSNCRERLAFKLGENVSQDEELVLSVDPLRFTVVEDSQACFATSLNDIVEVYLQLHRNDGTQDIPPLSFSLSLQPRFNSVLAFLKESAAQGQGISVTETLYNGEIEDEYYKDEDNFEPEEENTAGVENSDHRLYTADNHANIEVADDSVDKEYTADLNGDYYGQEQDEYDAQNTEEHEQDEDQTVPEVQQEEPYVPNESDQIANFADQYDPAGQEGETDEKLVGETAASSHAASQPAPENTHTSVETSNGPQLDATDDYHESQKKPVKDDPSTSNTNRTHETQASVQTSAELELEEVDELEPNDLGDEEQETFQLESDDFVNDETAQDDANGGQNDVIEDAQQFDDNTGADEEDDLDFQADNQDDWTAKEDLQFDENDYDDDNEQYQTAYDLLDDVDSKDHLSHDQEPEENLVYHDQGLDNEDEIDFEDDLEPISERHATAPGSNASSSLVTKRSFNELTEAEDMFADEHEAKKARAT